MTSCSVRRVIFRADVSRKIGTGHITRCLTLAQYLLRHRVESVFICRSIEGHRIDDIQSSGFEVVEICSDVTESSGCDLLSDGWRADARQCLDALSAYGQADWLIVDHYSLDARWERMIRPLAKRIMVIDDLADRPHDCDYLLDQTYGEDGSRYRGLLPEDCCTLFGAPYVLLRPEFAMIRSLSASQVPPANPKIVHVFFGGSDVNSNTLRFSRLLLENFLEIQLKVVVGQGITFEAELRKLANRYESRLLWEKGIATMAECMASCDVAVGAPGMATWERACLGLPAAYVAVSKNQVPILEDLAMRGLCLFLGVDHAITDSYFTKAFESFLGDHARLVAMHERGRSAIDGLGGERVASVLSTVPV